MAKTICTTQLLKKCLLVSTFLEGLIFGGCNPVPKALSAYGWILHESGPYPVNSYKTFAKISSILFWQLMSWANRRHPELNRYQTVSRYWLVNRGGGWVFTSKDGPRLRYHRYTRFWMHIKVQGKRSPFDGDWIYWGARLRSYPGISPLMSLLLRLQNGRCKHCGLNFLLDSLIEVHHLDGNHDNNRRQNLALLHRHCHDQTHAAKSLLPIGTHDIEPS